MDPLKIIKIEALYALLKDTADYNLRSMQRWFSREFNTALHVVEDLDIEYVAMHWFECEYERMTPEEREEELRKLTETDVERIDRLRKEESDKGGDDEFLKQTIEEAKKATKNLVDAIRDPNAQPIAPVPVMGGQSAFNEPVPIPAIPTKVPEGIKMEFGNPDENFEDWDLFGPRKDDD